MKVNLDKLEGLHRKLSFEVSVDQVREAFDRAYREVQKDVTLKGFRKGKAPMNIIRSQYGDRVKEGVLQELLSESYQEALRDHSLEPVGNPHIHFESFGDDKDFLFTAEFEVRPEVVLREYEGLPIEKKKVLVKDTEIQGILERIQNSNPEFLPVFEDRSARDGDTVEIDFAGVVDGQPLEGAKAEGHLLELGSKSFIEGFEEGVTGMKIGESRTLNLTFPDQYHQAELAGKPVEFQVSLKALKQKKLLEIGDELAKKVGDFETLQSLKDQIYQDLEARQTRDSESEIKDSVLKALVEKNPVEVPKSLHQRQKELLIRDVSKRMSDQGHSTEEIEEYCRKWDDDFNASATFMIQSSFLVDALADRLSLHPSHDELHEKIKELARQSGMAEDLLNTYYHRPENQSRLEFQLMEEKVVAYLVDKAKITEVMSE